ncbi:MAG: carboxypeptidase regulatory-like domain-containing protein [Acidimicrobiia bacterium]|nr:carboxypeptidase regulatory-like domain-containing protein [Acidimicrobiia bacterium]
MLKSFHLVQVRVYLAALLFPVLLWGQTSTTATIVGTISDSTGAVISGATVELVDVSTNQSRKAASNDAGQYIFPNVVPGTHRLTASMQGFRQAVIQDLKVDVTKSYSLNVTLEVGGVAEVVEVSATAGAELQTLDSTVGAVLKGDSLLRMPAVNRSAVALLSIQPMVQPARGIGSNVNQGGQVAGARSDQSTFNLDGTDATDLTSGTGQYFSGAVDFFSPSPSVPVPLESLEEFRVSTTNPNATFGRSAGGQINFVTKRGTNNLHGSGYWYHQNDNMNANFWRFNRLGIKRPETKDNRFGTTLGGPVIKNRTFLFGHYEGRRFPRAANVSRIVPTSTLRQGILRFRDAAGNVNSYNVRDFDPRRLGPSPVITRLWNALPEGNDSAGGAVDGLNTIFITGPADNSLRMDFGVARLDHQFNDKWRLYSTYRYATQFVADTGQIDTAGLTPGATRGQLSPTAGTPVEPRFFSTQLTGTLSPNVVNELNVGYIRNFWAYKRANPFPQVQGTSAALLVAHGIMDSGVDFDTQRGRSRIWRDQTYYLSNNLTWVKGKHNLQFGGSLRFMPVFHERDDKVIGSLTYLVYEVNANGANASVPAGNRPVTCGAGVSANCLASGDVQRWNDLFAASLGIVDKSGIVMTRDTNLNPLPLGTPMRVFARFNSYEFYANDIWRVTPSLTVTAGLTYNIQTPPVDKNGYQTLITDSANGEVLDSDRLFGRRREAALAGRTYNPTIGYVPIRQASQKYVYNIDKNNFGPRISAAWNPGMQDGLLGKLLGNKKTVIRAGYGVTFDRTNGVGVVMLPILGVGFSQTITCFAPRSDGTCGITSDPANAFRIGVDGSTVPSPPTAAVRTPIIPGIGGESISSSIDPNYLVGRSQSINLTVQREVAGNMIVEVGYVGRYSNDLPVNKEWNSAPYFHKDSASGQTFAQAFDAVAGQLRGGTPAAQVAVQPWFENQFRGNANCAPNCTVWLAGRQSTAFVQGQVNNLFNFFNAQRPNDPFYNRQVQNLFVRASGALSNYNAGFVTVTKRFSQDLHFTANYTFSRTLDQYGLNQEYIGGASSPYDLNLDYGPALFDRTHVFNSGSYWELPVGRSKRFQTTGALDKVVGGWYLSGIFTANSGLPLLVNQHAQTFGGSQLFGGISPGVVPAAAGTKYKNSMVTGVAGSGGVGTTSDAARNGSGMNFFANPEAAYKSFRPLLLSQDGRHGRGVLRGFPRWNFDLSIGKKTTISESVRAVFTFDMINAFNRVEFADPTFNYLNPASFGAITDQFGNPRQIQVGLRFEF